MQNIILATQQHSCATKLCINPAISVQSTDNVTMSLWARPNFNFSSKLVAGASGARLIKKAGERRRKIWYEAKSNNEVAEIKRLQGGIFFNFVINIVSLKLE